MALFLIPFAGLLFLLTLMLGEQAFSRARTFLNWFLWSEDPLPPLSDGPVMFAVFWESLGPLLSVANFALLSDTVSSHLPRPFNSFWGWTGDRLGNSTHGVRAPPGLSFRPAVQPRTPASDGRHDGDPAGYLHRVRRLPRDFRLGLFDRVAPGHHAGLTRSPLPHRQFAAGRRRLSRPMLLRRQSFRYLPSRIRTAKWQPNRVTRLLRLRSNGCGTDVDSV